MFNWFKKDDINNADIDNRNFNISQLQILKKNNLELKALYENSKKISINKKLKEICKTSDKILVECINDNSKISKLNLFINYYQIELIKILVQYISIKTNKIESDEAIAYIVKVNELMDEIPKAFNKILEELVMIENKNIDVDIKIMLKSLEDKKLIGEVND